MIARRYLRAVSAGGMTQMLTVALGFLALWLTTLLLDKQSFGEFMIAFAVVSVLSLVLAAGPQGLVLYHVSRAEPSQETAEVVAANVRIVLVAGLLVSAGLLGVSDAMAGLVGKPDLGVWLPQLIPFVVFDALLRVLASWDHGRQRVVRTALFRDVVPLGVRCGMLASILVFSTVPSTVGGGVAVAYVGGSAAALALLVLLQGPAAWRMRGRLVAWDYKYIGQLTLNGIVTKPQRSFDILLVGAFASATSTADFAVASRLANVLVIPKQVVALLLVPRLGLLLSRGEQGQLLKEFDACRGIVLLVALTGAIGFVLAGPFVLNLFGGGEDYDGAFRVLMILAIGMLVRGAFGSSVQLLNQAGMAGWTLASTLVASAVLILAMVAAVPAYGAVGGAGAVAASTVVSNVLIAWVLRARAGLSTMRLTVALSLGGASGVLLATAEGAIGSVAGALGLGLCLAVVLAIYAGEVRRVLGYLRTRRWPAAT